jgi:hypothetical protein
MLPVSSETWAKKKAKLHVPCTKIDFDTIYTCDPIRNFDIEFVNKGSSDLKITKVIPDCDCTTATYERRHYAPKELGKISVNMNLTGFLPGEIEKEIAIYSDSKKDPVIVKIKGFIFYKRTEDDK